MVGAAIQVRGLILSPPKFLTVCHRVNKFNIEALLIVFLPYHESPHFKKILSILEIEYVLLVPS